MWYLMSLLQARLLPCTASSMEELARMGKVRKSCFTPSSLTAVWLVKSRV